MASGMGAGMGMGMEKGTAGCSSKVDPRKTVQQVKWKWKSAPATAPTPVPTTVPTWTSEINGSERQRPFHKSIQQQQKGRVVGSPSVDSLPVSFILFSFICILIFILIGTT